MSSATLIDNSTSITPLNIDNTKTIINNNGRVVFGAYASEYNNSFSASINIHAVLPGNYIGKLICSFTLANDGIHLQNIVDEYELITPHSKYVANIQQLSGVGIVTVTVEG